MKVIVRSDTLVSNEFYQNRSKQSFSLKKLTRYKDLPRGHLNDLMQYDYSYQP